VVSVDLRWELCDFWKSDGELEAGRTILANPRAVTIHRAWMSP
jgi:hypothetical protein